MIKYRPHRGGLAESMELYKEFTNDEDMFNHIVEEHSIDGKHMFEIDDIVTGRILGEDERIGWKHCRYVCVKRYGGEVYPLPQCIGMCDLGEEDIPYPKESNNPLMAVTVADIIEEVKKDICDNYCKYSGDEKAQEEKCADCPLSRLG